MQTAALKETVQRRGRTPEVGQALLAKPEENLERD